MVASQTEVSPRPYVIAGTAIAGLGAALVVACSTATPSMVTPSPRAVELYSAHCAVCHGEHGNGDGEAAPYLFPPPRDFARGQFRLVSTENGAPTDADLVRVLRRGMPGSAMPPFTWLPEADLTELAAYVRQLAVEGIEQRLQRQGLSERDAHAAAVQRMTPGAIVEVGDPMTPTSREVARGMQIYEQHCAGCHGSTGHGSKPALVWTDDGAFAWARDFTAGVLKGGASEVDLTRRIRCGLPGSAMPPINLEPDDVRAVVAYTMTLIQPHAERRLVQTWQQIRARRVAALPDGSDDAAWAPQEVTLVLAPLSWRDDAIFHVALSVVHDGEQLRARLRWADPTRDDRPLGASQHADAAALQFSAEAEPPLFGMGSSTYPVSIWHWKPFRAEDVTALLEQAGGVPHQRPRPDAPTNVTGTAAAQTVRAQGLRSVPRFGIHALDLPAQADWSDGTWTVTLTRKLEAPSEHDITLVPGETVQVATAIWNGSARDHDSEKSITIWHRLELEK